MAALALALQACGGVHPEDAHRAGPAGHPGSPAAADDSSAAARAAFPQPGADQPGEWTLPGRDFAGTRYRPLTQITTVNAKNLKVAWTFSTGVLHGHEGQPVVVGPTMYLVTPYPNIVYALDLASPTGPPKWIYKPNPDAASQGVACCDIVNRGASYGAAAPAHRVLRVCADPNNLPFSNHRREGFENRLAEIVARELHVSLRYTWWAQRRGFIRNTLGAGRCDLVMGLPAGDARVLSTHPYYRSTYVFLTRRASGLGIRSLDDPRLRRLKIGVHFIGDDYHNTPAAAALARRGLARNLVGYSIYGDYSRPNPPARLIDAVAEGAVDVAVVWGPFAGYFGPRARVPLVSSPVRPSVDGPGLPFVFAIAAGVRRGDTTLHAEVDRALSAARPEVRALLAKYGVPLAVVAGEEGGAEHVEALRDARHRHARQSGPHDPKRGNCHPKAGGTERRDLLNLARATPSEIPSASPRSESR